ncbi:hypothetical protein FHY15_003212 [Xanthomonas arboricola]|nr:hypothetical protein [Xanthomonas arboricola]NJC00718.1 hypothetical protein [Xanthomonas arboricola]
MNAARLERITPVARFAISFPIVRNLLIERACGDGHSGSHHRASTMTATHPQLIGALLKGIRRAESARAASVAHRAEQMRFGYGTPDDAGKVLEMFALDSEQIRELGLVGVEELGEAVCHAWSINAGELDRVVQWFSAPRVEFVGKHCGELIRAGRIGPVLTMAREHALLRHR